MITRDRTAFVVLEGSPRDRGRIHGESARAEIVQGMRRWKDALHQATGISPDDYLDRLMESTNFMPAIERWAAHLLDEVRGIGEGAVISFRDIYAYQIMDEEWLFRRDLTRDRRAAQPEHCSTLGVFGERGAAPVLGQNMDLPKYYDGTQTLLHVKHDDGVLQSFVFTAAGLIGLTGMNNQAVGVCVNTLNQLAYSFQGLPVAFVTRRILESKTHAEAVAFVQAIAHAAGQNYAIGGPETIVDFECSAASSVQFSPYPSRVAHTNHPLVNDELAPVPGNVPPSLPSTSADRSPMSNSEERFAVLNRVAGDTGTAITVETVKAVLSTRDVPVNVARDSAGSGMTLGSLVMELSLPPVLHYAPGPPAETAYSRWAF
jgi:isopenicillin-N N-acyltransferase like protein